MNVFVAEDAPQIRQRLVAILRTVPEVQVVGESGSVQGAIDGALSCPVDTLLLDLQLVDGSGFEVMAAVKPQRPAMRIIVLTNLPTTQHRQASFAAGADVFLDKSHDFCRLPEILRGWLSQQGGFRW